MGLQGSIYKEKMHKYMKNEKYQTK